MATSNTTDLTLGDSDTDDESRTQEMTDDQDSVDTKPTGDSILARRGYRLVDAIDNRNRWRVLTGDKVRTQTDPGSVRHGS